MATTLRLPKRPQSKFLAQFTLDRRALVLADKIRGTPSLRAGTDHDGHNVLVKVWPRERAVDDADLRHIWRNETRQLHRLAGYRGVADYIAELRASGFDELGYYLVLAPGQRRPLHLYFEENADFSRPSAKSINTRLLIWENLLRVARGLEVLHLQGLLHRNLTTWSVLTTYGETPDFQLTGFEWSMRIVGHESVPRMRGAAGSDDAHSFARDWLQLGQLAIRLLEISASRIVNRSIPSHDVAEHVTAEEVRLIRELTQVFPMDRIDGRIVIDQMEGVLSALTAARQNRNPAFHLVLPVGENGPLAGAIREASGREIEVNDEEAQLQFIEADLSSARAILLKAAGRSGHEKLILRGERLTYNLDDFIGRGKFRSNWELAFCSSAAPRAPQAASIVGQVSLASGAISVLRSADAMRPTRIRSLMTPWSTLRDQILGQELAQDHERFLLKSLVLCQVIEYLFAASDVFAVAATEGDDEETGEDGGRTKLVVRPRKDVDREELSKALQHRSPPAARLVEALTGDHTDDDRQATWILTDEPGLGDKSETATEWQFDEERELDSGERVYIFSGEARPTKTGDLYLVPSDSSGRDSQLKRRLRSFDALAEHHELAEMLVDPRKRIYSSHDSPIVDDGFKELDPSKQEAFKAVVETLPLYLVQGPPGVGKTRLVKELVRQTLEVEKSTRILLSAQSNYAVDHLLQEIEHVLPAEGEGDVLAVRCTARDKKGIETRFDIASQARALLGKLLDSALFANATKELRQRTEQLAASYGIAQAGLTAPTPDGVSAARTAIESIVLRSANLVFATTNSADLERLIDERSQFDWAMIEEAAKATGGELVSPLLLSPRRLMIGDHKQLPPFGTERTLRLLDSPSAARAALGIGDSMIGRHFRGGFVEEIFNDVDHEDFPALCAEAGRNFSLFETLFQTEMERQARPRKGGVPIAAALTMQHRMHPAIARIVSQTFYDFALKTEPGSAQRFASRPSPVRSADPSRLPDVPCVWIDMPWIQKKSGMKEAEALPRFTNQEEVNAVLAVCSLLRSHDASNKGPTLAILSPYVRQARAMSRMIERQIGGRLANLSGFRSASKQKFFCNTVDSFQGSEADCVVISLVRNNSHGSIRSALGFLADARRMNVLMSRAKWRLVVIGSLDFMRNIERVAKNSDDQRDIAFLGRMLSAIAKGSADNEIAVVPANVVLPSRK